MKVSIVGGGGTVEVKEQEDGTLLGEDGKTYTVEHVSGIFTFVKLAEEVIDSVEAAVESIEEEVGVPQGVTDMTGQVEGYIEAAEDAVAGGIEATPVESEPTSEEEPSADETPAEDAPEADTPEA